MRYAEALAREGAPFLLLEGSFEARFEEAVAAIAKRFF